MSSSADDRLPRPSLEHHRKLAKDLLKGHRERRAVAARRFVNYHPRMAGLSEEQVFVRSVKLADAQLVVAREARFASWPELKAFCDGMAEQDADPEAVLFEAAVDLVVSGDAEGLARMVERHPQLVHARSPRTHRGTLLHYSAANGVEDHRQRTPPGAVAVADVLVAAGADIDAVSDAYGGGAGSTPLVALVTSGHPAQAGCHADLVRAFARSGQSLDGVDDDGLPLAHALMFRCMDAARALAECGARVDNVASAAGLGRLDRVRELLGDRDPPQADPGPYRAFYGVDRRSIVELALVLSGTGGAPDVARELLDRGVPVDAAPFKGLTALHEAAWSGDLDVVRLLLARGAPVDARDGQWGSTPVGWAAEAGHAAVVEHFLESAPVDLGDLVAQGRIDEVRRRLAASPGEVNGRDGGGLPLRIAAANGAVELVRLLLERGADRSLANAEGKTALDWAVELGHREVAEALERETR